VNGEDIERYLASDGWPCQKLDDDTWLSGFRSDGQDRFPLFVRVTQDWLCLTIVPFVVAPADHSAALPLYRRMLELNHELTLAKLGIDGRDVILTVELPLEHLVPSQLRDGLDAVVYYATLHHAELTSLTLLS
jgi:hypothetical protein